MGRPGNVPITQEVWDAAIAAYRKHGPKHQAVADELKKTFYTVKKYYEWGFPPKLPAIRDILAAEKDKGDIAPHTAAPAPAHGIMRKNDALHSAGASSNATHEPEVLTAPLPTAAAIPVAPEVPEVPEVPGVPAPQALAVVLDPAQAVAREAERVAIKALEMRPKLVGAEIDHLVMSHDLGRRVIAQLLSLWKGYEPTIAQLVERMVMKAKTSEVSEREAMRFLGTLLKHIKSASVLQAATIEQTRLVFGEPTQITEHRDTGKPGAQPPTELLARMTAMRERLQTIEAEQKSQGSYTFEEGGDDGESDD